MYTIENKKLGYRSDIDGLRAIAILPVILFHLNASYLKGGYYGVDVFFVISGFLITQILKKQIEENTFNMFQFWLRRVRRLLPALLVLVSVTIVVGLVFLFKPTVKTMAEDLLPAVFSYSNYHALHTFGDYWGGQSQNSFFLHIWSLAVEEQFYLVYPLVLFLSYKIFRSLYFPIVIIGIFSFSIFLYYIAFSQQIDYAFYTLPSRMWELLVGAFISINFGFLKVKWISKFLSWIGVFCILYSFVFGRETIGFHVLIAVLGSALTISFTDQTGLLGRILSNAVFVYIGRISYSLYLWHWCVIVFFKNIEFQLIGVNDIIIDVLIVFVSFVLAHLSYYFVENKTRNNPKTIRLTIGGVALTVGASLFVLSNFYSIKYQSDYSPQDVFIYAYDLSPNQYVERADPALLINSNIVMRDPKFNTAYKSKGMVFNETAGEPEMVIIGDSHGIMWAKVFEEIADSLNIAISCFTSNSGKPFINLNNAEGQVANGYYSQSERVEYAKALLGCLEKSSLKLIVVAVRWDDMTKADSQLFMELIDFSKKKNIKVLIINQPPVLTFMENKNAAQYFTYLGINPSNGYNTIGLDMSQVMKTNNELLYSLRQFDHICYFDVFARMIMNDKLKVSWRNQVLYFDDDHLSYFGASMHKKDLLHSIKETEIVKEFK